MGITYIQTFYARCINLKCRVHTWDDDDVMDWVDQHGRMRFYLDEEDEDSYSGVHDVHPIIYTNTYEYYNMHRICCSLCNEGAAYKSYLNNTGLHSQPKGQTQ